MIGTNRADAVASVRAMLADPMLTRRSKRSRADPAAVPALLARKSIQVVTFEAWKHIDALEVAAGHTRAAAEEVHVERGRNLLAAARSHAG